MGKVRVPVLGTVGKSVIFDDSLPARVATLENQITTIGAGGVTSHHALTGLQEGDDHPQYTMWQAAETIAAPWNFAIEPYIESILLTEFIQDTVGFLVADSNSITWNYADYSASDGFLFAHVREEFVQDVVGASLLSTASITLTYNDPAGRISATIIDEYVEDLIAATLCDSPTIAFDHYDTSGCVRAHLTAFLSDLQDVDIPTEPNYGDVLRWNGFSWSPAPP